ncbi:MAG: sigma 54-interacting transcriptional regulator [Bryobacteraceae bacterium]|jgi:Nif-specific regulatory protein
MLFVVRDAAMKGTLIATDGPLRGSRFEIGEVETGIGRISLNQIAIPNLSVSRRHCTIERHGERFLIRDLESHNGTFVNGQPVKIQYLRDGDRIAVGECTFLFQTSRFEPAAPEGGTVQRAEALTVFTPNAPLAREASALLRVSEVARLTQVLYLARDDEKRIAAERALFRSLFELIPAERGALFLGQEDGALALLGECNSPAEAPAPLQVDSSLRERVFIARETVSGSDDVGVWLAAPLVSGEAALGVVWLCGSTSRRFLDSDFHMITAAAGIMALAIENARRVESLENENRRLRSQINPEHSMVGEGLRMQKVFRFIAKVAPGNSTVLIRGESGTGKELVARAIHRNSPRAEGPFQAINCAALTETLLESELFGYEKGAFTGAAAQRKGRMEAADGGTLFLDEVGEMAPALQAKLLRVLQEHEFERVGGTKPIRVDLRLLAATNRDLEAAIKEGAFRRDLYYRLNVVSVELPPLRERRDDIPVLAAWFVEKYGRAAARRIKGISKEAHACLLNYSWPGNVRELENAIERAVVLGSSDEITPDDLPEAVLDGGGSGELPGAYHATIRQTKKRLIQDALDKADGNVTEAARLLGVHPNYLHRLVTNLQLRRGGAGQRG